MALRFPEVEDIPLSRPPLKEVICQVRFPPILSIGRGLPIEFQEAVRWRFPELEEEHGLQVRISGSPGSQSANAEAVGRSFRFRTAEEDALITLGVDAYAISTSRYTVWEAFAKDLALVHSAARAVYDVPYAKRIGLRYVNQLDAERTGCGTFEELSGFLRPELAALMATDAWDRPEEQVSQTLLGDENGRLVLRVAMLAADGQLPIILLDFDYYEEGQAIPLENLVERCARYHDVIYRAFRWSIRPEKLDVFAPLASGE